MLQQQQITSPTTPVKSGSHAYRVTPISRAVAAPATAVAWGVAVMEASIGYEWLLSGVNKVLSPNFVSGLASTLRDSLQGNPNSWYVSLSNSLIIPHARIFALMAEGGEILVALGMFAGAALWLSGTIRGNQWATRLNFGVILALLGGILMSVNYAVMGGDTLPGINAGNPFNEGLSIDSLLVMIGIGLLIVHLAAVRTLGRKGATSGVGAINHATRR
jgi:thiosulfate dehydrogenase [quinone] large subunit